MIRHSICIIVPLLCSILQAQPNPSVTLVTNGSLEILGDNNLPKDWRVITTWGPKGSFASDDHEHHSGQRSLRISADVSSQNYLATDGFGVSPGEVFSCSGWVKTKDVKTGENGKVQIQGVIAREDGSDDGVTIAALKLSPSGTSDWTHVEGDFKIPAQTTKAWVRFGMHDATGTTWWDDVDVRPQSVVAARIDVTNQRHLPHRRRHSDYHPQSRQTTIHPPHQRTIGKADRRTDSPVKRRCAAERRRADDLQPTRHPRLHHRPARRQQSRALQTET